jgi:indolepyruvate ferredoxin oxidoreductase beta subunit
MMTDWQINQPLSFVLVGVGGQGTILASDLLAEVGMRLGYDVKQAEIHGMSQRGGSVISNLRWASQVFSPIVPRGTADILIGFEKLEAVRFSEFLHPGGLALVNDYAIVPVTVSSGAAIYPEDAALRDSIQRVTPNQYWVKGVDIATNEGNARAMNVVMIGALAKILNLPVDIIQAAIEVRVPTKYQELNLRALAAGWSAVN